VNLYNGLVTVKGALRAVGFDVAFKPVAEMFCHCEPSGRSVYALF